MPSAEKITREWHADDADATDYFFAHKFPELIRLLLKYLGKRVIYIHPFNVQCI